VPAEIQVRLPVRLRFGGEQCGGFHTVTGLQAFLLAGLIVMDVINPAIAAVETESLLHIFTKQRKSVLAPRCRVRERHCCRSLPSEPDVTVSRHPAQAVAKLRVSGAGFHDDLIPASWRWMPNFLRNARSANSPASLDRTD